MSEVIKRPKRRKGIKGFNVKLQLSRLTIHLPTEVYNWVRESASKKSISLGMFINEVLSPVYEAEKIKE